MFVPQVQIEQARAEATAFGVLLTIEEAEFGMVTIECTRGSFGAAHLEKVWHLAAPHAGGLLKAIVRELIGEIEEREFQISRW